MRGAHRLLAAGVVLALGMLGGVLDVPQAAAQTPNLFHPITPVRVMDTRIGQGGSAFLTGTQQLLPIAALVSLPPSPTAVALNVTVTEPTASGFLTVWPFGSPRPWTSNVNFVAGQTVPNMAIVGLGAGAVVIYNSVGRTHVIVDVMGWFSGGFVPVTPARLMDTRLGQGGPRLEQAETRLLHVVGRAGVPPGATAVALNVTVTEPTGSGFVTAWPAGLGRPGTSNLNFSAGRTVANMVVVGLGAGGAVQLFNSSGRSHLVVDITGWFSDGVVPLAPARLMDSRLGQCGVVLLPGETRHVAVQGVGGVHPSGASAVVLNVTVTAPTSRGFLTVWPTGAPRPFTSNLNFVAGQTVPNSVTVGVGQGGRVSIYNPLGFTQVVVDVMAWFAGTPPGPPAPGCATTPPPPPPPAPFGPGTKRVGIDVQPGRYLASGGAICYWERLAGFGGTLDEIIANDFGSTRVIVDIKPGDVGFRSSNCGVFSPYQPPANPVASFGSGTYVVGTDIVPGLYASAGGSSCYWARLRGFGGTLAEIIANDFAGSNLVSIVSSDVGFYSDSCGVWTRIG